MLVDVSPGRVRSARISSATQGPLTDAYQPERPGWGPFTPDRTGQFRARIGYRIVDPDLRCLPYSGALPTLHERYGISTEAIAARIKAAL